MKVLGNIVKSIVVGLWLIVAIFVTVCLLSYNEFNVPVMGKTSLLIIDNEELEPDFKDRDLVIVKRESDKKINVGDKVFFYNGNKSTEYLINIGEVEDVESVTAMESTFKINGQSVSGQYVIGRVNGVSKMANFGLILSLLTSKWGFIFVVILPTLFALVYEVVAIVTEVKKNKGTIVNE